MGLLVACNDDQSSLSPTGILYLNVEEDATILTKAQNGVTSESLQVVILKGEEDTVKVYNDYLTEVKGERLVLPIGTYTVAVRSNGADQAGWETPLYAGQEEVEVKQGEITNAKVVCKIANTKVSVVYEESIKDYFVDYQTTVSNTSGSLTFTQDEYRSGFFTPEKLSVKLKLVNNDGNTFVIQRVYPDIEPQYHYTFKYTLANPEPGESAGADFDITIDDEHQEIIYDVFIKEEDLFGTGKPSASMVGFTDGVYKHKVTDGIPQLGKLLLTYKLGKKNNVKSFEVTTTSYNFISEGLAKFDLLDVNQANQAYTLGFPILPTDATNTDDAYATYQMDLAELVSKLACVDNKPTLHTFTVSLIDDKYQETTTQFAIRVMPDVAAYVEEPYCWSTFAVLRGNGAEDCYFVLTTPEGKEIEISDQIKFDDTGNMSVLVTGLKNGAYSYQILSKSDNTVSTDEKPFTIYDPNGEYNVPNLGFDTWTKITENRPDFTAVIYKSKEYWAPNVTTDYKKTYWESGNFGASVQDLILAQGTSERATTSDGNTQAALLTSRYAGIGSLGAFSAGSVFIGNPTSVGTSGAELLYGRLHRGLPTRLSGYYKYKPGLIDYKDNKKGGSGTDQAIIYIALSTKSFALKSLTGGPIVRFDKNAKEIFAYAELIESQEISTYKKFDIPLIYLKNKDSKMPSYSDFVDANGTPKIYITIVATCSMDGDMFTGSTSSEMYIDEFELNYDYDAASFKGTEFENMTPININDNK